MPRAQQSVLLGRVALAVGACLPATGACSRPPAPPVRPNVLLVTLDTTRADHLGCYGYPEHTSENIDRLADRGALFTSALAQAAVTPVSHASILTGLNPYTHGLRVMHGLEENRLPDSCVTMAEVLREAGYQTAAFVSAFPVAERFGLHQGFETFDADFLVDDPAAIVAGDGTVSTGRNQRRADATTDRALTWLAQAREPFCLWVHYFDPHDPQLRPPDDFLRDRPLPAGSARELLRALYDAEIRFMDRELGRIFDQLHRSGRFARTVIVVTADHGEGLGDHNWWTHGILYQEQIRVPLIVCAPGIAPGTRSERLVRTIDIVPTVLELVGLARRRWPALDGVSLVPLLRGNASGPAPLAYADSINMLTYHFAPGISDEKNDMLFAAVDGTWKYIHHALRPAESELYNLQQDPHELTNLYASHPAQVRRLLAELRARDCFPARPPGAGRMSPEDLQRLRSLGYVVQTQPAEPDDN